MLGFLKSKATKSVRGKLKFNLKLYTSYDFELECELEVPRHYWVEGVLKVEKKFKKKGLRRVDSLWEELPIDSKSVKLIEGRLLKEILPSVLDVERPKYQSKKGKTLAFSSAQINKLVLVNKKPNHIAKISINGIWYDE